MKPSRRSRLASTGSSKRSKPTPVSPPKQRTQPESVPTHLPVPEPQTAQTQSTSTLTAAARYQKNLKSLRRVDPTIISIIDQFSHICLYRLHDGKWQKDGFEGASFLFERAAYPPYGLFILNRAGMHDYTHFIHPEDEIQPEGEYLMYRSYPEFTAKRLAMAKSAPATLTESWTDAHRRAPSASDPLTNWRYLLNQKPDKGPDETVMFWFLGSDSEQHEPLSDTIERLMTFIRKGEPYPYNLGRLPPPAQHPAWTDVKPQEASATSPVDATSVTHPDQAQSNGTQPPMAAVNGTGSEIDKLFSKLIPAATPAATPSNSFTSASTPTSPPPASNLVRPPSSTTNIGPPLLHTIFASATPPLGSIPAPTPPLPHHVSSEPFPPPPSAPPSTRLAFATAHMRSDISSSEPEPSESPSPTCHTAAALIHSPQPTNSQLPQILTQDVISALLGMPPSRTSSVASSHRRYEGDVESSDDPHEVDSPIDERPQTHANRPRKHELGDVTPRPPLLGFGSSEKVLPSLAPPLPSYHSAPSALPSAASSSPSVPTPSEPSPTVVVVDAPATAVPAPRIGTSPAPRTLVPFHAESSLWPYPRAPLDDRDDIVELDFADTSALSDVDAFERRRQNGRNARLSKKDKAREREEIERSWDTPGNGNPVATSNVVVAAGSPGPVCSRPSSSQALSSHNAVVSNGSAAAATWSSPQSCAPKANRTNIASAPVKTPYASSTGTGGQATAPTPSTGNNKSTKAKSKHAVNGSNAKNSIPDTTQSQAQTNGATTLAKSAASAAIVEAVHAHNHSHSNVNGSASLSTMTDRNEFVKEVLTLIHTVPSFVDRLWTEYRARA